MADGSSRLRLDDFRPFRAAHDSRPGEADEEPALQGSGDTLYLPFEPRRVRDGDKPAIRRVVAPIRDERVLFRPIHPELRLAS